MNIKKGLAYVFFATGVGFVISLITNFVLPKFLSVETYADIKLYQLYITYIGILHLGFADGMYLRLGGKNLADINKEVLISEFKTFKIFQIIINIIAIIISICLKNEILMLVAISIFPVNVINYFRNLYKATGLYDLYSKFTNTNNIMLFVINMILLFVVKTDDAIYYIIGNVVVYFLNWILMEQIIKVKVFQKQKGTINIRYFFEDIKEGLPLMLGNFCTIVFTSIDRMFSKYLLGTLQFAHYSFAVSVEGLINTFITPIVITMYNYLCVNEEKEKVVKIKKLILVCVSIILASAYPVKWIINNFIVKYKEASNIIFILFAAQFFTIIVKCVFNNLYKAQRKQKRYFTIIIIVTILAVIFDIIAYIISKTNEGLAFATLLTSIIWFIIGEFDFKESKYKIKEYIFMSIVVGTFLITGLLIDNAIIGCAIYLIVVGIAIFYLLKEELFYLIKEGKKVLLNIIEKFK